MKAIITIFTALLFTLLANRAEGAVQGETRFVFIGDSITGQGGGWLNTGYVFKMREALSAAHPERKYTLVPLGGSGMGVASWLALARDAERQKRELDIKGVEIEAALSERADVMIVMLGMNDVLAPYVSDTDESLDQWIANYRDLVGVMSERLKPELIALATITPQTEDPETPVNRVLARMNARITTLAGELHGRVLPTNAVYWDELARCRKVQADFSLAADRIHPNSTGHIAVAMAMLNGLRERTASVWLREERLAKLLASLKPVTAPTPPPEWLLSSGLVLRAWQDKPSDTDLAPNPIDLSIESGTDFTKAATQPGGASLSWRRFQSNIGLTDGANPGSVDFAGATFFQNFEAGYGARWIRSPSARRLKLNMKTSGVGTALHLTVWVNGQRLYSDLLAKEPKRQTTREVDLSAGWNVLVFKSCHRTWQWQQALNFSELDGTEPEGLEYSGSPPHHTAGRDSLRPERFVEDK